MWVGAATWSIQSGNATIQTSNPANSVIIEFPNAAQIITVNAVVPGTKIAPAEIAVVKVQLGTPSFTSGAGATEEGEDYGACLAIPGGFWVTSWDPGSDWAVFKYSGQYKNAEPLCSAEFCKRPLAILGMRRPQ